MIKKPGTLSNQEIFALDDGMMGKFTLSHRVAQAQRDKDYKEGLGQIREKVSECEVIGRSIDAHTCVESITVSIPKILWQALQGLE